MSYKCPCQPAETTPPHINSLSQHSYPSVFLFPRVLNEFILKNPNLESKKDQRELQVITGTGLTLIVNIMSLIVCIFLVYELLYKLALSN